jgi:hypothetical protein
MLVVLVAASLFTIKSIYSKERAMIPATANLGVLITNKGTLMVTGSHVEDILPIQSEEAPPAAVAVLSNKEETLADHEDTNDKKEEDISIIPITSDNPSRASTQTVTDRAHIININANSTLADSIEQILHYPNNSTFEIHLKALRRCERPLLKGRISGPSLSMIKWMNQIETDTGSINANVLVGSYDQDLLPISGKYFVEIIGVACSDLKFESKITQVAPCVENPEHHRITSDDASINVHLAVSALAPVPVAAAQSDNHVMGRWINTKLAGHLRGDEILESEALSRLPIEPIFTRYQAHNCRSADEKKTPRCSVPADLTRFNTYEFQWLNATHTGLDKKYFLNSAKEFKVCIVGFSHSRHIEKHIATHIANGRYERDNKNLSRYWAKARYPSDISDDYSRAELVNNNCTQIILGLGQWPGSKGMDFTEFNHTMKLAIDNIVKSFTDIEQTIEVFMRSIHLMPIGDSTGMCECSSNVAWSLAWCLLLTSLYQTVAITSN